MPFEKCFLTWQQILRSDLISFKKKNSNNINFVFMMPLLHFKTSTGTSAGIIRL